MGTMLDALFRFFTGDEWYFMKLDNQSVLKMDFQGKNGKWSCYAQINEEKYIFQFYSVCPVNVPPERRSAVGEYLTRANYGLLVGNFEFDLRDGEIRYKTSVDVENAELSQAIIKNQVYANVWSFDRYLPGIFSVVYGNMEPIEALEKAEKAQTG
jgi:hypothetical protein